jgi:hypothetical protein
LTAAHAAKSVAAAAAFEISCKAASLRKIQALNLVRELSRMGRRHVTSGATIIVTSTHTCDGFIAKVVNA